MSTLDANAEVLTSRPTPPTGTVSEPCTPPWADDAPGVARWTTTTSDFDDANQRLSACYGEHHARLAGPTRRFVLDTATLQVGPLGIDRLFSASQVEARFAPLGDQLCIARLVRGRYELDDGRNTTRIGRQDLFCLRPHQHYRTLTDDAALRVARLDLGAVARTAAEVSGLAPEALRFHRDTPASGRLAAHWDSTMRHLATGVLADHELLAQPLIRAQLFRTVALAALTCFPNTALDAVNDPTGLPPKHAGPSSVRRAAAYIDAHAHEPISLTEIAAAARVGPRALQLAFRRHLDQTPLEYLRLVRLHRAHQDLRHGDPARGDTVTGIAARWGF